MATYTTIVDPGNEQVDWETDYTSLNAWEAGEQSLYTSGDIAIADCRRSTIAKDENNFAIAGWTSGVVPKIIVHDDYRHEGKVADQRGDDNYVYKLTNGASGNIRVTIKDTHIEGLFVLPTSDKYGIGLAGSLSAASDSITIKNCIIDGGGSSTGYGISSLYQGTINAHNCIALGFGGASVGYGFHALGSTSILNAYNCVSHGNRYGYVGLSSGEIVCINTIASSNHTGDYTGTDASSDYNMSTGANAPGTNSLSNQDLATDIKFVSTTADSEDFHLQSTSDAIGAGIGPSSDANVPTTDIDGDTRSGTTCDIGADEYVATATFKPFWALNATRISL